MIYIVLGAPGVGKGTISKVLSEKAGILHISTGSMLREDKKIYSKYEKHIIKGKLIPDDIINRLVSAKLQSIKNEKGYILDGYPRTKTQAEYLSSILINTGRKIKKVLLFEAPMNIIESRIFSRRICPKCETIYSSKTSNILDGKCKKCGEKLVLRTDDNEETLKNRIEFFYKEIDSIAKYYEEKGMLKRIDSTKDMKEIIKEIEE